ncbi:TIGR01777 family protein [Saccharomonospora sp. CUA-673]|uniref:TIGR01777 family oxidoreductase n=1 Tax=Saccharomonospora sp. CUA-673 TaxID=1904969 RepID=UPI0009642BE1|nr:TIGR01777 family oxidoreductase [Saccharomonospora sp. CUA-673]OLT47089.1 TIGR01777 family protein [Saccharomonospora sp. CUA-673]
MRVLVAGSSGLLGGALTSRLRAAGHDVVRLVRRPPAGASAPPDSGPPDSTTPEERSWDPPAGRIDDGAFDGVDAVVNLCGASLASGRWSGARKQHIVDSRIEPTEVLAEAVARHHVPVLLNASGINVYGDTGDREVDETATAGAGFLAELCTAWEGATEPARQAGTRVVLLRTSPVLARDGGLLGPLKILFRLGLGGKLGDGTQYFPWISLDDHIAAMQRLLTDSDLSGPVNLTAPTPVTNAEFTRALGRALRRPTPWRAPRLPLRAVLGEAADEMLLTGPRAVPERLRRAGFTFTHPGIDDALSAAV